MLQIYVISIMFIESRCKYVSNTMYMFKTDADSLAFLLGLWRTLNN